MESECSLQRLPSFSQPDQTSPCPSIPLPNDPSLYYLSIYVWVFPVVSFRQAFPPKLCIHLSSPPTFPVYLTPLISKSYYCLIEITSYRSPFTVIWSSSTFEKTLRVIITEKLVTRKVFRR